jgi:hypothetical protein
MERALVAHETGFPLAVLGRQHRQGSLAHHVLAEEHLDTPAV